ncbi:MAG: N-acetyltransferase family protein [Flavisolibacter sp.]
MVFREAGIEDIPQIQVVRHSVKENVLSDPSLVTDKDCEEYIIRRGKGWVCETHAHIVGFSIVDLKENNIWALFVDPEFEGKGIGKKLHHLMLSWYFKKTKKLVWLGTSPNTRAATFYKKAGWTETGIHGKDEIKFEMTFDEWIKNNGHSEREILIDPQ